MDPIKDSVEQVISRVLDGTELKLQIDAIRVEENFEAGELVLRCEVHDTRSGDRISVNSHGNGLVDAFVRGILDGYGAAYVSLRDMRFTDFNLRGKGEMGAQGRGSDMPADASVRVANGSGHQVTFTHTSPSVTNATLTAVLRAVEFFINAERAFISLHRALARAKQDKRPDSGQIYTQQLAILVQLNNYTAVSERLHTGTERP